MDTDLVFVIGIILGGLAIPSVIGAFTHGRAPRVAMIMIVISGAMIVYAMKQKPSGYAIQDIPSAFSRVVDRYLN